MDLSSRCASTGFFSHGRVFLRSSIWRFAPFVRVPGSNSFDGYRKGFSPFIFKSPLFIFSAVSVHWGEARCRRPSCRLHLVVMIGVLRRRRPLRHLRQDSLGGNNIWSLRCWGLSRGGFALTTVAAVCPASFLQSGGFYVVSMEVISRTWGWRDLVLLLIA